jgi:hypothetical protein
MATRMQQRRGTAAQWTSADPVLNPGEIGWESDTNKFKIGDGTNHWDDLSYFLDDVALGGSLEDYILLTAKGAASGVAELDASGNILAPAGIIFEGTANNHETTLSVTDPTADRTITFPDVTGTVITTGNLSDITNIGVFSSTITMEGSTANDHELTISAGDPTADRTATFPDATGTVVIDSATQTLTNKTLTSPVASGLILSDSSIVIEGSSANDFETTLTVTDPTADRTITLPDVTGTVVTTGNLSSITSVGTLASLTVTGDLIVNGTTTTINSTTLTVDDKNIVIGDVETPTDTTADGGGITLKGATDKTFNWVDTTDSWTSSEHVNIASGKSYYVNGTLLKDLSETLTNKTLTTPVISSISNTGTLTLPTETDTLVGRATTDTLTNKTLGSAVATTALTLNATAELRLADTDSSHYVGFKSPGIVTANKVWVLPAEDGTAGQALSTDGSGNLSWATAAAGGADEILILMGAL